MLSQINGLVSKWILICKLLIHFHWRNSFSHKCIQPIYPNLCFFWDPFFHPQICPISNNVTVEAWFEIQKPVWIHNIHIWEFGLHLIINNIFTKFCLKQNIGILHIEWHNLSIKPKTAKLTKKTTYLTDNWSFMVPEGSLKFFDNFFTWGISFSPIASFRIRVPTIIFFEKLKKQAVKI